MQNKILYNNGQFISYTEYGNPKGFPVFVQHGMVASIKSGGLFNDSLKECARIICMARPGYGESSSVILKNYLEWGEIVQQLAEELSLSEFDIFSSSAGAPYGYAIGNVCSGVVRNIYVYSGSPAFYDEEIQNIWPYPIEKNISQSEAEKIAYNLFFANASQEMLKNTDIKDSMNNNCFGIAQELRIRFRDWGFDLSGINSKVYMQHGKKDEVIPYKTAERTADLLPDCSFELFEEGVHFSVGEYRRFIDNVIVPNI